MGMALTDRAVRGAGPGRHGDGTVRGLMLVVKPSGARSWVLRYQLARPAPRHGPRPLARDHARPGAREGAGGPPAGQGGPRPAGRARPGDGADLQGRGRGADREQAARAGATPSTRRSGARRSPPTPIPKLGDARRARRSTRRPCSRCCGRSGPTKPETASRVRQRIEAVLDYAAAHGRADRRQPGALARPPRPPAAQAVARCRPVEHHAALDWREAPAFMAELAKREGVAAQALAFAILTAARSGEVRGMTWGEVDREAAVWTVPAGADQGRQGAPGAAHARGAGAARRAGRAGRAGVPEPDRARQRRSPT